MRYAAPRALPLFIGLIIIGEVLVSQGFQWDFKVYYSAAEMDMDGEDPYDFACLRERTEDPPEYPFLYPPITLALFRTLSLLPFKVAYVVWLVVKLLLLVILVTIWQRHFVREPDWWMFALFIIFAFGAPLSLDIRAGNVTIVEQTLLWAGFAALYLRRYSWFCALVLIASLFKWTPAAFLGLLLLTSYRYRWHFFIGSSILFLLTIGLNYAMGPDRFAHFLIAASAHTESAQQANPSTLMFFDYLGQVASKYGIGQTFARYASMTGYVLTIGFVFSMTVLSVRKHWKANDGIRIDYAIFTACLVYALALPRFKLYAFVLLIPVAYYVIKNCYRGSTFWPLFLILCISRDPRLAGRGIIAELWWYYPIFLAYFIWIIWLRFLLGEQRDDGPKRADTA